MHSVISKALVAAFAFGAVHALPQPRAVIPTDSNDELIAKLITDPTMFKRYQRLLTDDGQQLKNAADLAKATVFDFQNNSFPVTGQQGGVAASSNVDTFPILINSGVTMNFASLGPCGVIIPHIHPRANEYFIVVDGSISFGYMPEIGLLKQGMSPEVTGKLTKYQGTLFPQGSVHYQINDSEDCKPAATFAALSNEDPGTTPILMTPAGNGTMKRQVEGGEFEAIRALLPPQIVGVVDGCLKRCNVA